MLMFSLRRLKHQGASVLALSFLLISTRLVAAPTQLALTFDLLQQGVSIGTVKDSLKVSGNQYRLDSLAEGKGIYKLMGERTLSSRGTIIKQSLHPDHFESRQSKSPKKTLISDFDWKKKQLSMQIKSSQEVAALTQGTQDLLSVMYCWMWQPPKGKQVALDVATGKKLAAHHFVVTEETNPMVTEAGTFKVVKLADTDGEKTLYLARDKHYLPVKLVIQDDGKRMEQVITSITGQ